MPSPDGHDLVDLVRDTLAADEALNRLVGTLLLQPDSRRIIDAALGPEPVRRLAAFYGHADARLLMDPAQVHEDLAWARREWQPWLDRQTQARADADAICQTLQERWPLSTDPAESPRPSRIPAWIRQPWARDLVTTGLWNPALPESVETARRWLDQQDASR